MEKKIAQISDVHFGEKNFSDQLRNNLLRQLENENPDLIIVSGDLTTEGYSHEYELAAAFVDELRTITSTYTIPGNHDARNVGLIHFEKLIGRRKFVHHDSGFAVIGLDSSEPDINDGQIGMDQLEWLRKELERVPDHLCKIVTFHHHLLPIPNTGRERNILLDSGDLLKLLKEYGVDFVLNGHKHVPNVWMIEGMVTLNSGTATTRKLRGETFPSHNQLRINDDRISVDLINTESGSVREIASYSVRVEDEEYRICSYMHSI
ncbi:metallophosphoesterase [Methanothermobacter sp. EMTCatA1]|uniref:metallophosphoesterase family protein n=1 Tax=Methanothermobacter sp. EMTCatA1 TaxID=2017966 RepID=UPI000B5DBE49|nr:metallophosphoesterase [Methanothermobacter sp. EMTCatA1]BAZ99710.1 3',5'-cyclic adenosine monophosphate phosphodiesterase CpdA [Methanothermobacter sp. EMTCatA1]